MANIDFYGTLRFNPEVQKVWKLDDFDWDNMSIEEEAEAQWLLYSQKWTLYPGEIPKIFLHGDGVNCYPNSERSWMDDSVILVRNEKVMECCKHYYTEFLVKDDNGNDIWISRLDSDNVGGIYLGEHRKAESYEIVEYDFSTGKKKKLKVVQEEILECENKDIWKLQDYMDMGTIKKEYPDVFERIEHMEKANEIAT